MAYLIYILIGLWFHFYTETEIQKNIRTNQPFLYLTVFVIDVSLWWLIALIFEYKKLRK